MFLNVKEAFMDLSKIVEKDDLLQITSHVVSHYVTNHQISHGDLDEVIGSVYATFEDISQRHRPLLTYREILVQQSETEAEVA